MKKREVGLEQFFTTHRNAEYCLSQIDTSGFDLVVEPSAGAGAFSNLIDCIAYDIDPKADGVQRQDFLKLDTSQFAGKKCLAIGNPPFGRQSSLAIKFINKCAEFADTIAFVLPMSFKKDSMISKLDKHLFLEKVVELPEMRFEGNNRDWISCSFFVFKKRPEIREKQKVPTTEDFEFTTKDKADCSIRRVGYNAGRIEGLDVSESSHYFVKWLNPKAKEKYLSLKFEFNNTVGARSLSKAEILREYCK